MTAKFDYQHTQRTADKLITKFGMDAVLRRATGSPTDRPCRVVIFDEPHEKQKLGNPTDRHVYLSPLTEDGEVLLDPDDELDHLITFVQPAGTVENEDLPITCKPKKIAPAGVAALWEFTVRR